MNEDDNIPSDREILRDLRVKRLQRATEYTLLIAIHVFFLLAFREFYRWWMALVLAAAIFGMNFQLTQLRERRRTSDARDRRRIVADTFESLLFVAFIALLAVGGLAQRALDLTDQEYIAYLAAMLSGLFLAGLVGELVWQSRNFGRLDGNGRRNYVENLKRTIILPYINSRRRR